MTYLYGQVRNLLVPLITCALTLPANGSAPQAAVHAEISKGYGRLPLSFEANRGQADSQVDFISRGAGYTLFVTPTAAVFRLSSVRHEPDARRDTAMLRMTLVGADATARAEGREELPGKVNYFRGNDPAGWRTGIPTYAKIGYDNVYRGIDVVYYGNQRQLEYDFIIRPGGNPDAVAFTFEGAESLELDADGNLILRTGRGQLTQRAPHIYQEIDGSRMSVAGRYVLSAGPDRQVVRFDVGSYDSRHALVIDPVLVYSTYLGGAGDDWATAIAVDSAGSAYMTGNAGSNDFPTTPGSLDVTLDSTHAAFVTKLNASGTAVVYSTYLGGTGNPETAGGNTEGHGIAVDSTGAAYITGWTDATDFPTTPGAFDRIYSSLGVTYDAFVTKLDASGATLAYSTYLGGENLDAGHAIAVDSAGSAYVTGGTTSSDFPTTSGAFDRGLTGEADAFVTKLEPTGTALVYSTYLGGHGQTEIFEDGRAIAVDNTGSAYITGWTQSSDFPTTLGAFDTTRDGTYTNDAFVTKLTPNGEGLAYSTYLGGSGDEIGFGIAVDGAGRAYVTGVTASSTFPTTPGAIDTTLAQYDAFVTALEATGATLAYSTYLGGSAGEIGYAIAVDGTGSAYVTGGTLSVDFPTTPGAYATTSAGGEDVFVTRIDASGVLLDSTYLGGSNLDRGFGIALGSLGDAYVAGWTFSSDFPTTLAAADATFTGGSEAFVAKLAFPASDPDPDGDGIAGGDNCPLVANPDQIDSDVDGMGDACDPDDDNDGILDDADNCSVVANPDQGDVDGDALGDACDPNSNDGPLGDLDGDLVPNSTDNCPTRVNPDQLDHDADGQGDACELDVLEMVFASNRDGNFEIYGRRAADGLEVRLTNHPAFDHEPALSRDRKKVLFTSFRSCTEGRVCNSEIYVMNADGTGVTPLTLNLRFRKFHDFSPHWSPDGTRIVFASDRTGNGDIYVMNADGSRVTPITKGPETDLFPDWSPDGRRIAFSSYPHTGSSDIYTIDPAGFRLTRITSHVAADTTPSWSPDGTRIAFTSTRDRGMDVYVMDANGANVIRLTTTGASSQPAWGPTGAIAFTTRRGDDREIYRMNSDGSGQTRVTNDPGIDIDPHW